MMFLMISGRLVFEILKDKDVNKRFRVKIVDFQVAKTALHLVRGDLLLQFSDSLDLYEPPKSCLHDIFW